MEQVFFVPKTDCQFPGHNLPFPGPNNIYLKKMSDLLIRGGHVLDPSIGLNLARVDVLVRKGKVHKVGKDIR